MRYLSVIAALAAAGVLSATLGAAGAGASSATLARKPPAGYKVVSKTFTAAPGVESDAVAVCPKATVPIGGGGLLSSSSPTLSTAISASFPFQGTWAVNVQNGSSAAAAFRVVAVCAAKPTGYKIIGAKGVANPAGTEVSAAATCPAGTRPLGGGGVTSLSDLLVSINSTAPQGNGWMVTENNASSSPATAHAIAVCGRLNGYRVVHGAQQMVGLGAQGGGFAACPAPTVPISGGVLAGASPFITMFGSEPSVNEWDSFVNNITEFPTTATAVAVCANR